MNSFIIEAYRGTGGIDFGMTPSQVFCTIGKPLKRKKNFFKEDVFYYDSMHVCFSSDSVRLVEVGFSTKAHIFINGVEVFSDPHAFSKLIDLNGGALAGLGCTVLLNLGIALTGFVDCEDDKTVTAFARGRWDSQMDKLKPFLAN